MPGARITIKAQGLSEGNYYDLTQLLASDLNMLQDGETKRPIARIEAKKEYRCEGDISSRYDITLTLNEGEPRIVLWEEISGYLGLIRTIEKSPRESTYYAEGPVTLNKFNHN